MKTSEVFKRAKQRLAVDYESTYSVPSKEKFICMAVRTASAYTKRITPEDIARCEDIIGGRLEGNSTFEGWLTDRGCIDSDYYRISRATKDRIQQHRHAWLDMLIAEFEAQGD